MQSNGFNSGPFKYSPIKFIKEQRLNMTWILFEIEPPILGN